MYGCEPCDRDKVDITDVCEAPSLISIFGIKKCFILLHWRCEVIALCLFCLNIGVYMWVFCIVQKMYLCSQWKTHCCKAQCLWLGWFRMGWWQLGRPISPNHPWQWQPRVKWQRKADDCIRRSGGRSKRLHARQKEAAGIGSQPKLEAKSDWGVYAIQVFVCQIVMCYCAWCAHQWILLVCSFLMLQFQARSLHHVQVVCNTYCKAQVLCTNQCPEMAWLKWVHACENAIGRTVLLFSLVFHALSGFTECI